MNAGFDDYESEFTSVNVEPRRQSNDPPPEFTGTKPSEIKSYRKKVKLWPLFRRSSSVTCATCFEQADRPSMGCL